MQNQKNEAVEPRDFVSSKDLTENDQQKENEERFAKLEQKQNNNIGRLENGDNSSENDNISNLIKS
ncbi:29351_t:CDS:2, partial [Gigaspora margarita]